MIGTDSELQQMALNAQRSVYQMVSAAIRSGKPAINLGADLSMTLDESLQGVPNACQRGCAWCCYHPVGASPVEIFMLAAALRMEYEDRPDDFAAEIDKLKTAARNAEFVNDAVAYRKAHLPCPMLQEDGSCGVYEWRPLVCRGHQSMSASDCRTSHDNPSFLVRANLVAEKATLAWMLGAMQAMRDAGRDPQGYDFIPALIYALEHPESEAAWNRGETAFPGVRLSIITKRET